MIKDRIENKIVNIIYQILGMEKSVHQYFEKKAYKEISLFYNENRNLNPPSISSIHNNPDVRENKTIWVYWRQGFENAPDIVKVCHESVLMNKGDWDVVSLSAKNIGSYIQLPDYIEEKRNAGTLCEANYSDLVRTQLLIQYGGIWLDATCLMSHKIPDIIEKSKFFVFSMGNWAPWIDTPIKMSSWCIRAQKDNELLIMTRNAIYSYLMKECKIPHYNIYHLTMSFLIETNDNCKKNWDEMPFFCNINPHKLQFSLSLPYNESVFNQIMDISFVHKLTYRISPEVSDSKVRNNYQHLISMI